jgi:hypothetical protein
MRAKKTAVGILVSLIICGLALAADYIKSDDIQKVNLGDTFDQVSQKIGQPQQMLSKSLDAQGKEQVVWLYKVNLTQQQSGSNPGQGVLEAGSTDTDTAALSLSRLQNAQAAYLEQKTQNMTPAGIAADEKAKGAVPPQIVNAPYLIIFTDGKVSSIKRQGQ